jgi:hypothetical protein
VSFVGAEPAPAGLSLSHCRSQDFAVVPDGARERMTQATAEKLAARMLASSGLRAIWDSYVAASAAHGLGRADVAEAIIAVAEAAEREWMQRAVP